jgi:predicted amidohydrolase
MKSKIILSLLLALLSWSPVLAEPSFNVATLTVMPEFGNKAANFAVFEKLARQAAASGADLVVTCEGFLDGYAGNPKRNTRERMPAMAEPIDGPWLKKVAALAGELKVHVIFGFSELRGGKVYNTAALFSPDGLLLGSYSKTHLAGKELYERGTELPVFDTGLGRMGILICFDRRPPENARVLALKGAQFIVVPAYGERSTPLDEDVLMQARAQENGIYMIYTTPYNGVAVDPDGEIISKASGPTSELMFARIDLDPAKLGDEAIRTRHTELYEVLTQKALPGGD